MTKPIRLLVVEDEPTAVQLLTAIIKALATPIVIDTASTLAEACAKLADEPSAIVLDLNLPDSNGLDTMAAVRRLTAAPIIVASASHDSLLEEKALALGAVAVLRKATSTIEQTIQTIEAAVSRCDIALDRIDKLSGPPP